MSSKEDFDLFDANIRASENLQRDFKLVVGVSIFREGASVTLPTAAKILKYPYKKILRAAKNKILVSRRVGRGGIYLVDGFDLWVFARCHLMRELAEMTLRDLKKKKRSA